MARTNSSISSISGKSLFALSFGAFIIVIVLSSLRRFSDTRVQTRQSLTALDGLLTANWPIEDFGLPGFVDESGHFHLKFQPEIRRVFLEVGLYNNPSYCELPLTEPDVFVIGWEANKASWQSPGTQRCQNVTKGKYAALPFAAASGSAPLAWNTAAAEDMCASLSSGFSKPVIPANWIQDPLVRADQRCISLGFDESWRRANAAHLMRACQHCQESHMPHVNIRFRVPTLSLEAVLLAIPQSIVIEKARIDAQGVDLEVLKSAGSQLYRIQKVEMEVQDMELSNPDFLYGGPLVANAEMMKKEMKILGFDKVVAEVNNCACIEYNLIFSR